MENIGNKWYWVTYASDEMQINECMIEVNFILSLISVTIWGTQLSVWLHMGFNGFQQSEVIENFPRPIWIGFAVGSLCSCPRTPPLGSYAPQCWLASSESHDYNLRAKILQTEDLIDAPLALPMQSQISVMYVLVH
jgi:hypothetical protein